MSTKMARQNAGKGRGNGRAGRNGRSGAGQKGRRSGYLAKPKTTKVGLCKVLESNVFHYGGYNAANTMRVTQEKSNNMLVSSMARTSPMRFATK
jgi:hypothetical protein